MIPKPHTLEMARKHFGKPRDGKPPSSKQHTSYILYPTRNFSAEHFFALSFKRVFPTPKQLKLVHGRLFEGTIRTIEKAIGVENEFILYEYDVEENEIGCWEIEGYILTMYPFPASPSADEVDEMTIEIDEMIEKEYWIKKEFRP
jgi:hypothetical protein